MSYEPTNWKDGDLVTSAKLNKIEQGIAAGGGVLIVHEDENGMLDKTWQEIYDADACIIYTFDDSDKLFELVVKVGTAIQSSGKLDSIQVFIIVTQGQITYVASSQDDYPVYQPSSELPSGSDAPIT